jgi:PTH1 family peptidyl-tRNA hydrolase
VVHDELDLEPGRLQFKFGGGLAGHNGLRSIKAALQTQDFARLRIGIGRPERKDAVTDWVLRRPTGERKLALQRDTEAAANALATLIDDDFEQAQRVINGQRG